VGGGDQLTGALAYHIFKILHSVSTSNDPLFSKVTDVDLQREYSALLLSECLLKEARTCTSY
jgi:hypothetical protein